VKATTRWKDRRASLPEIEYSDRPKTPEDVLELRFRLAALQLDIPNLIPGKESPPEFTLPGKETPTVAAAFEQFLDRHFPRRKEKFADLRDAIDLGLRDSDFLPLITKRRRGFERQLTPLETYRFIVEERKFLRAMSAYGNYFAKVMGRRRPPLQVCEACGKLFLAERIDKLTCSENCSAARRMARMRANREQYEYERKKKGGKR